MSLSLSGPRLTAALAAVIALGPAGLLAAPRTYAVDAAASSVRIHVGKSGAFGFAGHTHEVVAPIASGEVVADSGNLGASRVSLSFDSGALRVLAEGEPGDDRGKVEEVMRGPRVLDVTRFPAVTFRSETVAGKPAGAAYDLDVAGVMGLHGVSRPMSLPVHVEISGDTLTATGNAVLRQDQFGMQPVTAAGGAVKVKNEVQIAYRIVARAR
jgi:polyisoprenoid-binding protein YceI